MTAMVVLIRTYGTSDGCKSDHILPKELIIALSMPSESSLGVHQPLISTSPQKGTNEVTYIRWQPLIFALLLQLCYSISFLTLLPFDEIMSFFRDFALCDFVLLFIFSQLWELSLEEDEIRHACMHAC
jgi:hypothetical protein